MGVPSCAPKHPDEVRTFRMAFGAQPELALFGDQLTGSPSITVVPVTGSTGTVTVGASQLASEVASLTLTNAGSGYATGKPPPNITIAPPPTGEPASATCAVNQQTGGILETSLTSGGIGYTTAPTVTFDPPPTPTGVTATATAVVQATQVWVKLSGGTDGNTYLVTVECQTAGGSTLVGVGILPVSSLP